MMGPRKLIGFSRWFSGQEMTSSVSAAAFRIAFRTGSIAAANASAAAVWISRPMEPARWMLRGVTKFGAICLLAARAALGALRDRLRSFSASAMQLEGISLATQVGVNRPGFAGGHFV